MANAWGGSWGKSWGGSWGASEAAPEVAGEQPLGTAAWLWPGTARRTRKDIRKDRERFGIPDEAAEVISEVAARQAEQELRDRAALDEQKRFEELHRELELQRIEWDARYLEVLAALREQYIKALKQQEEEQMILMLVAAAVA